MHPLSPSPYKDNTEPFGSFWSNNDLLTGTVLREAASWGYEYPASLQKAIQAYEHADKQKYLDQRPLNEQAFQAILEDVKEYAIGSNAHLRLPYHYEKHFKEFARSALMLFDRIHGNEAMREMLAARQAIELAGWLHDCHHTGCTLRWDYDEKMYEQRPDYSTGAYKLFMEDTFGRETSTEYVSAWAADRLLERLGLSVPLRIFVVNNIWATTFGGSQALERGIKGTPVISNPNGLYHALMRVADIWYPKELKEALTEAYRVCVLEYPADGRLSSEDVSGFIKSQIGYLHYRLSSMRWLDGRVMARYNIPSITAEGQECAMSHIARCHASLNKDNPDTYVWDIVTELLHRDRKSPTS